MIKSKKLVVCDTSVTQIYNIYNIYNNIIYNNNINGNCVTACVTR